MIGEGGEEGGEPAQKKAKEKKKYATTSTNAKKGDVKQFFARTDFDGEVLEEDTWRCELCSLQNSNLSVCVFSAPEGNSNLVKHLLTIHGVDVLSEKAVKAKKSGSGGKNPLEKPIQAYGSLAAAFKVSSLTKDNVEQLVAEYVFSELFAFRHVERENFQRFKTGLLGGRVVAGPSANKLRKLLLAEELRLQGLMKVFFKEQLLEYSLSGDGKKCVIKGLPMYGVCLHAISKELDLIVLPLNVAEPEGKTTVESKKFVQKTLGMFELSFKDLIAFTGDEAEHALSELLGCVFIRCGPHRLATSANRAFKAVGLTGEGSTHLLEASKAIVQFCVRRYRARKLANKVCPPVFLFFYRIHNFFFFFHCFLDSRGDQWSASTYWTPCHWCFC